MKEYKIWDHEHFQGLKYFKRIISCSRILLYSNLINSYATGAELVGLNLYSFHEGDIILSSLINFRTYKPGYTQFPWTLNLAGVPILCYQQISSSFNLSFVGNHEANKELSIFNTLPKIDHHGRFLTVTYENNWFKPLKMQWPIEKFDDHGQIHKWNWARKLDCVVAYTYLKRNQIRLVVCDLNIQKINFQEFVDIYLL